MAINHSQYIWSSREDMNLVSVEYGAGIVTTWQQCSVKFVEIVAQTEFPNLSYHSLLPSCDFWCQTWRVTLTCKESLLRLDPGLITVVLRLC
jgi:hypothetical protein